LFDAHLEDISGKVKVVLASFEEALMHILGVEATLQSCITVQI